MNRKIWCLTAIFIFSLSINAATINPELILDLKAKPALVRINSIIVIEYSYTDQNGILKKQNFFSGRVGTGIIINATGNIIINSHCVEPIHQFENDFENFLSTVKPAIMKQISAAENLTEVTINKIDQWLKNKKFTILDKKAHKQAVLANREPLEPFAYQIVRFSPSNMAAEISILKIESEDLPMINFSDAASLENILYAYHIESPKDSAELINYYTNPRHSFKIIRSKIVLDNISADSSMEDYSQAVMREVKKIDAAGIFITADGKVRGILSGRESEIFLSADLITKQLADLNVSYNQEGNFNKIINQFIDQVKSGEWEKAEQSLKVAAGLFRKYDDFAPLQAIVEKNSKENAGNLKDTFQKYKIFIVIFGILVLALVIYLIFLKSKKNEKSTRRATTIPDLPEEITPDTDATIPDLSVVDDSIARIDILINDELDNTYKLSEGETKIGRDPSLSDIIISELIVSKIHCLIYSAKDGIYIKDQNSTNGVYVDGYRVENAKITRNSRITLGKKGRVRIILK